ncbi:MAG: hypothetical protein C4589_09860 [Peptococcaceae bacterium]|nr:MAG: hypothetical protein C4589_09860 [Peptococcaceae bacterium]
MENIKITSAEDFKRENRKVYQLPSGKSVLIRKLKPTDFVEFVTEAEKFKELSKVELLQQAAENPAVFDFGVRAAEVIICKGVLEPKVSIAKSFHDVADDEIHISDLNDEDLESLITGILQFSGVEV